MSSLGYVDAVVLGVVEGLTEFLPVSSTGHLTAAEGLLNLKVDDKAVTAFTAIIQFGAIIATILYFRSDIVRLALAWLRGLGRNPGRHGRDDPDYRFAWFVIAGSVPIVIIALVAKPLNLWVVAAALILWSAVMWWAERHPRQELQETDLTLRQVVIIGLTQCVALIPGVSRSGATISAGLMLGATRVAATRMSFFLAIPALTGAGLVELKDIDTSVVGWGPLAVGTLISFLVAYASIAWLLKLVARHPITVFIGYRLAAGTALIVLLLIGALSAT
jgi:undecaprenyl-diphosphatase